ncbi:hypothetical protein [Candidatus Tisiphia endosymbiont of Neophilaenus lineatus]|uniref:hypothetical protein n=1 Tax=Candidatus Tisiphia endosymbiont of Neophilaenus lineatus TaxID=3139336 RepID=UPI0035CA66A2
MLTKLLAKNIDRCKVDIWSQDETRVGQQGSLTRIYGLSVALDPVKFGNSNLFQHIFTELLAMRQEKLVH